jgi:hypothetical protein
MISDLTKVSMEIAKKKNIGWYESMKSEFWKIEKELQAGIINSEAAVERAKKLLKIDVNYGDDVTALKRSIR